MAAFSHINEGFFYAVTDEEVEAAINNEDCGDPDYYFEELTHYEDPNDKEKFMVFRTVYLLTWPRCKGLTYQKYVGKYIARYGIEFIRYYLPNSTYIDVCVVKDDTQCRTPLWYYSVMRSLTPLPNRMPTAPRTSAILYKLFPQYVSTIPQEVKALCEKADVRPIKDMPQCLQYPDEEPDDRVYIDLPDFEEKEEE